MGTFATTTSLDTLMPGFSLDTSTVSSVASICITWAENHVKAKLSRRYDVGSSPFNTSTSIPPQVTSLTEQIAMGHLFKVLSRGAPESLTRGNELIALANESLLMLANRECDLVDTTGSFVTERTTSSSPGVISSASSYHTTFNEDDPLNWNVDSNKLDDISSDRTS